MSDLIDRQALLNEYDKAHVGPPGKARKLIADAPTASPWHRADEPPKEVGCYLVVGFDRHWFYDIAEYFPTDNEWATSENQSDSTYIRYWMPLPEPPKEVRE